MLNWSQLSLFASVALILVLIPGPNTLYIVARSIQQGRKAGLVSGCGVQVGTMVHLFAAAFGLSALLLSSAYAFNIVRYGGAAYLIYLGIKTLLTKQPAASDQALQTTRLSRVFSQGVIVNVLNPKTALFFFAFLPQFIDPARGGVGMQIVLLGSILIVLGTLSDSMYALAAGTIGNRLRGSLRLLRAQRYFAGCVYLGLGTATAFTGAHKN
jgi:threonine/homoserine/homoserine lactone efflux protein